MKCYNLFVCNGSLGRTYILDSKRVFQKKKDSKSYTCSRKHQLEHEDLYVWWVTKTTIL